MARTKQTTRYSMRTSSHITNQDHKSGSRSPSNQQQKKKEVEINANQFSIKFDNQKQFQKKAVPFKVVECQNCGAFLNSKSTIRTKEQIKNLQQNMNDVEKQFYKQSCKKQWQCQFCITVNLLPEDFEGLPQENQCYLLQKLESNEMDEQNKENILLYCIDISGSMDTKFQNKSRIEAVKEAISDEIKRMKFEKQKIKIGIVTFGSLVTLFNQNQNITIPQEHYNDFQAVVNFAKGINNFSFSIGTAFQNLKRFVEDLSTYGSTALGPGLLTSIELASSGRKGSKIIVCTDGEANIGLNGPEFYTKAAEYAKIKGVVVNILSIKGDKCNLKQLGKLTLSTGGSILKIDPSLLGSEFNKISKQEILGSESRMKIIVNQLFQIQNSNGQLNKNKTTFTQNYGSFNQQTQLTFNFKVLSKEQTISKGINYDHFANKVVPMQVHLSYTTPNGNKYLQVITDFRQLTQNKNEILKDINFGLYSSNTLQRVSELITQERYQEAQVYITNYDKTVDQVFAKTQDKDIIYKFKNRISKLDKIEKSKKQKKQKKQRRMKKQSKPKKEQKKVYLNSKRKQKNRKYRDSDSDSQSLSSSSSSNSSSQKRKNQQNIELESDSQEEVLYRQMRARSRSKSHD